MFFLGIGDHGCEYMTGGRVIILGNTGRNFAAGKILKNYFHEKKIRKKCSFFFSFPGMSGGIAYILNKDGKFQDKCNLGMVELTKPDLKDQKFLKETLNDFVAQTGSEIAQDILDNFDIKIQEFIKVFPYEYQRALKDLENEAKVDEELSHKNGQKEQKNGQNDQKNGKNGEHCDAKVADIEDSITDVTMTKKKMEILDKTRGFVKYDREKKLYKDAKLRQEGNQIHIYMLF